MDYHKGMVSMCGAMDRFTRATLSKDYEMDTVFGNFQKQTTKNTKDTITWIKRVDTEYMNGRTDGLTEEISKTI